MRDSSSSSDLISTDRLWLRRWRDSDLESFATMNQDAAVMRYFPRTFTAQESAEMIDRMEAFFEEHGYGRYVMELKSTGEFIGFTGISTVSFEPFPGPPVEIGWRLKQSAWGMGYATEAALACLDQAVRVHGLEKVSSFTSLLNTPSERVMQRIGMVRWGEFDHPRVPVDHPLRRHVLYTIALNKH